MKKTVLLFGGNSDERLVSVASAQNAINHYDFDEIWFLHFDGILSKLTKKELLDHKDVFEMEFNSTHKPFAYSMKEAIPHLKDKIVFLALHGTDVEDGTLQTQFEESKILFSASGSQASRDAFVKDKAKQMINKVGINVPPQLIIADGEVRLIQDKIKIFFEDHKKIVLKPLAGGSSIGLHIISDEKSLNSALMAIRNSERGDYLVEKFIHGRELTVGVIDTGSEIKALPPSEILLVDGQNFDYSGKYLGLGTTEITPAKISTEETKMVQDIALKAHQTLKCYGYSRTDLIKTDKGVTFLETNTLPGITKASFVPQQLAAAGISFHDFIQTQLQLAENRYS